MEPYCLVLYLESDEVGVMAMLPESLVPIAKKCGWHVLGKESEIGYREPIDPAQSNPHRVEE